MKANMYRSFTYSIEFPDKLLTKKQVMALQAGANSWEAVRKITDWLVDNNKWPTALQGEEDHTATEITILRDIAFTALKEVEG